MQHEIIPTKPDMYATYIQSRNGQNLKQHKTLGSAKNALLYHHWQQDTYGKSAVIVCSNPGFYTNGLYRWEHDRWVLIFVSTPTMTRKSLSNLLRYIKR